MSTVRVANTDIPCQVPQKSEPFPPLNLSPRSLLTIKTCTQCKRENAFHYHTDPHCITCELSIDGSVEIAR